ncbi:MAG TPA: ABC transporter substrate-binding protein [Pilimelia sp.]|nr:ABC transporter substrate-binding protein [Pilimelia sp.]
MATRRKALAASSLAVALAFTAACGGGGDKGGDGNKKGSGFNAAVSSVVNPSDKKGGTLNLYSSADLDSWDPARTYYAWGFNMHRLYSRTLVAYDGKVGKDGLKLVPDLASAEAEISDDGKKYTYKLRDGLKFEDGTPITSKDIKYGIQRVFATDVISGGPTYLIDFLDQGQGYKGPYKDSDPDKLGLKSIQTPDDKTIVFTLAKPFADFPYLLAMPGGAPVPRAKDTGAQYGSKPVSSGPYKIKTYEPNKKIIFERNENWDPATDPFRKALPDVIDLTLGANADDIDNRLLAGSADLDVGQTGVSAAARTKIVGDESLKANTDNPTTGFIRYVSIQTKVAPFDNVECRRAVHYAADKTALQTARGGPVAGGDIGTNMLPPNIAGHDPNLDPYNTKSGKPQIDKAKEALAKCGKPDGFKTVIAVRNNKPAEVKTAEALQASLKAVGIDAAIEQSDGAQFFSTTIGTPSNVQKKGYGLAIAGWGADFQTAYGYLQILVDGRAIKPAGNNNYAELNDPEINSLIDKSLEATDPAESARIWGEINAKVMDQAVMMPMVYDKALNYRNPRLTNVYVHDAFGMVDFQALGVSDGK